MTKVSFFKFGIFPFSHFSMFILSKLSLATSTVNHTKVNCQNSLFYFLLFVNRNTRTRRLQKMTLLVYKSPFSISKIVHFCDSQRISLLRPIVKKTHFMFSLLFCQRIAGKFTCTKNRNVLHDSLIKSVLPFFCFK